MAKIPAKTQSGRKPKTKAASVRKGRPTKFATENYRNRFLRRLVANGGKVNKTCKNFGISHVTLLNARNRMPEFDSQVLECMREGQELELLKTEKRKAELDKETTKSMLEKVKSGEMDWKGSDIVSHLGRGRQGNGNVTNITNNTQNNTNININPIRVVFEVVDPRKEIRELKGKIDTGEIIDAEFIERINPAKDKNNETDEPGTDT